MRRVRTSSVASTSRRSQQSGLGTVIVVAIGGGSFQRAGLGQPPATSRLLLAVDSCLPTTARLLLVPANDCPPTTDPACYSPPTTPCLLLSAYHMPRIPAGVLLAAYCCLRAVGRLRALLAAHCGPPISSRMLCRPPAAAYGYTPRALHFCPLGTANCSCRVFVIGLAAGRLWWAGLRSIFLQQLPSAAPPANSQRREMGGVASSIGDGTYLPSKALEKYQTLPEEVCKTARAGCVTQGSAPGVLS